MSDSQEKKEKQPKISIEDYIASGSFSERDSFAYIKAYSKEKPKTSDEWSKFLKN